MAARPIRIRRGRRTDFGAVMELLAGSGAAMPPPDRATLRRFRQLVADLGADLYVATIDERVVGVVHVTYARQLAAAPRATLATLAVDESARRRGVGRALLQFVAERARRRACVRLLCPLTDEAVAPLAGFVERTGARPAGTLLEVPLTAED